MQSRQRILTAINHQEPDRVPFDLGGTVVTGIQAKAYRRLRNYLGLPDREIIISDIRQQLAMVDDDVLEILGVDVRNVSPKSASDYKRVIKRTEDGRYDYFFDEFGIGWRMPVEGGLYYDMFEHPLSGDISDVDLDDHLLPNLLAPERFSDLRTEGLKVIQKENRGLIIGNISGGIFELYTWNRGYKEGFADWVSFPSLVNRLLNQFVDLQIAYWDKIFTLMQGIPLDVIHMADDMAGQTSMLISPGSYRRVLKPLHKKMFDFIHTHSEAKIFFHSCGSIRSIIPDLIDVGVDILNPVQVSARDMDSADLKREFGKEVVFWGGGVDTQNAFDERHTPQEVCDDVKQRLDDLMPGGGFVFSTIHNIQGNVPPENIMAMWETLQKFGKY
jgi:uroporphyrinogen decarboxylase